MPKLWICLAFLAISGCRGLSYDDNASDGWYDDYWYDADEAIEKSLDAGVKEPAKSTVGENTAATKPADEVPKDDVPSINDYQLEDNRSELEDNFNNDSKNYSDRDDFTDSSEEINNEDVVSSSVETDTDKKKLDEPNETSTRKTEMYDDVAYMSSDSERKILEETEAILHEDNNESNDDNDFGEYTSDEKNKKTDVDAQLIDETSKILDDTSDLLDESIEGGKKTDKDIEEIENQSELFEDTSKGIQDADDDDTVDKAFNDLMSDLDKLQKTWTKLRDYDDENVESSEMNEENGSYDYEEIDDDHLDQLFEKAKSDSENEDKEVENVVENISENTSQETRNLNRMSEPILYLNDALVASDAENKNVVTDQTINSVSTTAMPETSEDITTEKATVLTTEAEKVLPQTTNIVKPTSAEGDIEDFTIEKKDIQISSIDVKSAISVELTTDSPVVVTSPNYPLRYPTGRTVDWMIVGDGIGIELNITDFEVNGLAGHYLYMKPGGFNMSGSDGLLFTHSLTSERRFRFLDVDRMFMRFEAVRGMQFAKGFSLSMRMVSPRPGAIVEPEPEPIPVIPQPPATITLNLGGISLNDFIGIEEQFRVIVADMATLYINTHNIDPGLNTTIETTQITSKALCFHNWPKFELCTEVRFGVPIVYEEDEDSDDEKKEARLNEEDLMEMWESYSQRDPFAVRLRMLGITEYQVPNDRGVLIIWLVIAAGVVISMAMLAFALWRFSCFADYTRMPSFSDTDSIKEKRNLDLYPTPHQTLPPLYSETDYKWADAKYDEAKMEIGGYSNRSYMSNDFYEIDSDEDVRTPRDRGSSISPRDIYSV